MLTPICRSRRRAPFLALALQRILEQQTFGQRVDRLEQPLPEIGRERELAGCVRAEMIERDLPVDQPDQLVDDQRGDDRLGVDEESTNSARLAWLSRAPGVRSAEASAIAATRLATASAAMVSAASRVK